MRHQHLSKRGMVKLANEICFVVIKHDNWIYVSTIIYAFELVLDLRMNFEESSIIVILMKDRLTSNFATRPGADQARFGLSLA